MSVEREFETVDVVLATSAPTRRVDAFALALIKAERQARKLFTHLVYQHPRFQHSNRFDVVHPLRRRRDVYFEGVLRGLSALYPIPVTDLVGSEHDRLRARIDEATKYRNKIFHGQLTPQRLSGHKLESLISDLRSWCEALSAGASGEFGYDGFRRNSLSKSAIPDLGKRLLVNLATEQEYADFIVEHMTRRRT